MKGADTVYVCTCLLLNCIVFFSFLSFLTPVITTTGTCPANNTFGCGLMNINDRRLQVLPACLKSVEQSVVVSYCLFKWWYLSQKWDIARTNLTDVNKLKGTTFSLVVVGFLTIKRLIIHDFFKHTNYLYNSLQRQWTQSVIFKYLLQAHRLSDFYMREDAIWDYGDKLLWLLISMSN